MYIGLPTLLLVLEILHCEIVFDYQFVKVLPLENNVYI